MKNLKLSLFSPHPENPREEWTEKQLKELAQSIKKFPQAMALRGLIVQRETGYIVAGNQRHAALVLAGRKTIPENWVQYADGMTEEQIRQMMVLDNSSWGNWAKDKFESAFWEGADFDAWSNPFEDAEQAIKEEDPDEFKTAFNGIKNDDAETPIVPDFMEDHECFVIPCHNEIDVAFIRETFGLDINYRSETGKKRKSNLITPEKIRLWILES